MTSTTRDARLRADHQAMQALAAGSTILSFETDDDPPEFYRITLRGRGVMRTGSYKAEVEPTDVHKLEIQLSYRYPERPPDVRWRTPIFHPNISYSGGIRLADCGIAWDPAVTLDVVCEALWDAARLAHVDLKNASNYQARKWFDEQSEMALPADPRPLRDRSAPSPSNVIRYKRPTQTGPVRPAAPDESDDVLFIGEETIVKPEIVPPRPKAKDDDDDVLYIGE